MKADMLADSCSGEVNTPEAIRCAWRERSPYELDITGALTVL